MNEPSTSTATPSSTPNSSGGGWKSPSASFNVDLPWQTWLVLLFGVLAVALFYVVWMYIKDSRGVGAVWASLLGFLRLSVYGILAVVFLLPANQSFVETRIRVQGRRCSSTCPAAWHTSDELATDSEQKLQTRMDRVADFLLKDGKANFLPGLEKKNPITAYRFGSKLDEEYLHFANGRVWTREEKEKPDPRRGRRHPPAGGQALGRRSTGAPGSIPRCRRLPPTA